MIKGAIFDVDGTLLDSMSIWENAGELYLAGRGLQAEPDLGKALFPMSMEEGADYIKKEYHLLESRGEIMDGITEVIKDFYYDKVGLKSGAFQFLKLMKEHGVKMVIATSGDADLTSRALSRLKVRECFERIVTCTEVGQGKSKPDIYLKSAEYLQEEAQNIWVFEDTFQAMLTAHNAGFRVAGVYDTYSEQQMPEMKQICDIYMKDLSSFWEFWKTANQ